MEKDKLTGFSLGYELDSEGGKKLKEISLTGKVTASRGKAARTLGRMNSKLTELLSYTSMRAYGLFMLGFGGMSLLLHFANDYLNDVPVTTSALVMSIVLVAVGVLFSIFDKPIAIAFQDFKPTDYIFFDFFCIKRMHRETTANGMKPIFGLIFGFLMAAFGVIVPMWTVVLVLGALLYLFLAFMSPEFSFFATFLIMPYLPTVSYSEYLLAIFVAITVVSFIAKVVLGKRVYHFEPYDALIGVFLLFVLISGIFVKGIESFGSSLVIVLLSMGYVLTSSLVSNRRLAEGAIQAIIISAVPVSVITLITGILQISANGFAGFSGVSGTFNRTTDLAAYLLVAAAFAIYFATVRSSRIERAVYALIAALFILALASTACTWAFISALVGLIAYGVTKLRRGSSAMLLLLALLPHVLVFMPMSVLKFLDGLPILSSLSLPEFGERWRCSVMMLLDNFWAGVGIGSDSFAAEYIGYSGGIQYPDSGNFFLEIACEAGIFALLAFLSIFILRLHHRAQYDRYLHDARLYSLCGFITATVVMLFAFGALNYLWSDMISNYLYWCVFAIGNSALRISRSEHDQRIAYYSDGRSFDSSSVDISLV